MHSQKTVSLPVGSTNRWKAGNSSVIPFIGDQTAPILMKLIYTVNIFQGELGKAVLSWRGFDYTPRLSEIIA